MKKKNTHNLLIAILVLFGLIFVGSCVKTDNVPCSSTSESPVIKVEGADTAQVNVADTLIVSFLIRNTCGKSASINPTVNTSGGNVHVVTTYEGCACSDAIIQVNQKYVFKAPAAGRYTLSFWGGNDATIIEKTIVVN